MGPAATVAQSSSPQPSQNGTSWPPFPQMVETRSSLPSPRSDNEYIITPEQPRNDSLSPSIDKNGDTTSADEATKQRRRDIDREHMEPTRNEYNKMICDHPKKNTQCTSLTFDRKCEWLKHIDKHDRPYRCEEASCSELRGFTYSGGLLRHQREVHKKFGGPKSPLYCPFQYCKRSTGTGFTRNENLKEHIRRVHRPAAEAFKEKEAAREANDVGIEEDLAPTLSYTPDQTLMEIQVPAIMSKPRKRKKEQQLDPDTVPLVITDDDVREEIIRLRYGNQQRDHQIAQLHALLQDKDMRISKLEEDFQMLMAQQAVVAQEAAAVARQQ